MTDLENEADEREEEVCSRDRVKHSEMNDFGAVNGLDMRNEY